MPMFFFWVGGLKETVPKWPVFTRCTPRWCRKKELNINVKQMQCKGFKMPKWTLESAQYSPFKRNRQPSHSTLCSHSLIFDISKSCQNLLSEISYALCRGKWTWLMSFSCLIWPKPPQEWDKHVTRSEWDHQWESPHHIIHQWQCYWVNWFNHQ